MPGAETPVLKQTVYYEIDVKSSKEKLCLQLECTKYQEVIFAPLKKIKELDWCLGKASINLLLDQRAV